VGLLDWLADYIFRTEKQTLIDLRTHSTDWFNQVTEPLKPILTAIEFDRPDMRPKQYAQIAMKVYEMKITSNAGEQFENILESMRERGIPIFTSRRRLKNLARKFYQNGLFVKHLAVDLYDWSSMSLDRRADVKKSLAKNWKEFASAKEEFINEINSQLRKLG
jgi:hypothetical protein